MKRPQMPTHRVDQHAAALRDASVSPDELDAVVSALGGLANGFDEAAADAPDVRVSLAEVAEALRAARGPFERMAAELRKGGQP